MKKNSKVVSFLLVELNSFIIMDYYIYPKVYNNNPKAMLFYYLFAILMAILIYFIIPKFKFNYIKTINKNMFIKYSIILYFLIQMGITMVFTGLSLSKIFYQGYSPYLFMTLLVFALIMIKNYKVKIILNTACFFILFVIPFFVFNGFSHFKLTSKDMLFQLDFNISNYKLLLLFLYLIFDNYMYIIISLALARKPKKILCFSQVVYFIVKGLESLMLFCLVGSSLKEYLGIGYLLFNIEPISKYIGNFDFVYIYIITLCGIAKILLAFKIIELITYDKKRFFGLVIPILSSLIGFLMILLNFVVKNSFMIFLNALSIIPIVFIGYLWRCYFENRRINNKA